MADVISVDCSSCGKRLRVKPEMLGRKAQCPHCKSVILLQAGVSAFPPVTAPTSAPPAGGAHHKPTTADIFGPEPLPQTHRSQTMAKFGPHHGGSHGQGGHGQPGEEQKFQMPPRKNPNTMPLIFMGVGGGVILIVLLVVGLMVSSQNRGLPTQTNVTPNTSGSPTPFKPVQPPPMSEKERAEKLLAKPTPTEGATLKPPPDEAVTDTASATKPDEPRDTTVTMRGATNVNNDVAVSAEFIHGGYAGDILSYVAGHVNNGTGKEIRYLKITVPILDRETKKEIGQATGVVLNVPAGKTVPYIAEWTHDEDALGVYGTPTSQIDPPGSVQGLPSIEVLQGRQDGPVTIPDPNSISAAGEISLVVTNRGVLPVSQVELIGLLLNKDGRIVGAAKGSVRVQLAPGKPQRVKFPWRQCAGSLVESCEVWAQAKS
jgi:hypothetical protein